MKIMLQILNWVSFIIHRGVSSEIFLRLPISVLILLFRNNIYCETFFKNDLYEKTISGSDLSVRFDNDECEYKVYTV